MVEYSVGSLFTGIGMIDYAFEQMVAPDGSKPFKILWQVENDDYCNRVLEKHWPGLCRVRDAHDASAANLCPVDVMVGGFPCQDISNAGRGEGIKEGNRSGLWFEFARLIGELRPRYVFLENVPPITSRGGTTVLAQLAQMGYDAEWGVIPASAVGAPHRRERWFCVAYAQRPERRQGGTAGCRVAHDDDGLQGWQEDAGGAGVGSKALADAAGGRQTEQPSLARPQSPLVSTVSGTGGGAFGGYPPQGISFGRRIAACGTENVANAGRSGRYPRRAKLALRERSAAPDSTSILGNSNDGHRIESLAPLRSGWDASDGNGQGIGLADSSGQRLSFAKTDVQPAHETQTPEGLDAEPERCGVVGDSDFQGLEVGQGITRNTRPKQQAPERADDLLHWWTTQSRLGRAVDGLPAGLDRIRQRSRWPAPPGSPQHSWEAPRILRSRVSDRAKRLKALGNSVVWQVVAPFAEAIWWALEEERLNG